MECSNKVPHLAWYKAIIQVERLKVRQDEDYTRQRNKVFRVKSLEQKSTLLKDQSIFPSSTDTSKYKEEETVSRFISCY